MTKPQVKKQTTLLKSQKVTLLICSVIMAVFILLVAVASNGSLSPYTFLHIIVLLMSWYALKAENISEDATRYITFLSVVGAASAIFLVVVYLPLYIDFLDS